MKKVLFAAALFGFGVVTAEINHYFLLGADFDPPLAEMNIPLKITAGDASLTIGTTAHPGRYGFPKSAYLVIDKEGFGDDASLVLREAGNARAEIGLNGDNDIHFKTVTGAYREEEFTDRFLIRASGEVDAVGTILRQFATTGTPIFAVGDSDGKATGSGIEIAWDHDKNIASITSIERGETYHPLNMVGLSHSWFVGVDEFESTAAMSLLTDGTLRLSGDIWTRARAVVGGFTVATLPPAAAGGIIYVSDGAAGTPVLAFSDGTTWLRSDTRGPVTSR